MVVPYQYSTSNRNGCVYRKFFCELFLISILHQTATGVTMIREDGKLFLISILHQTATVVRLWLHCLSCSLSVFYIKPQQKRCNNNESSGCSLSVFYIKPQQRWRHFQILWVVPYQYSTSNRNKWVILHWKKKVVPYQYSTSNRNVEEGLTNRRRVVPYQYSTSNRNTFSFYFFSIRLFLISILHQTATALCCTIVLQCCSLSVFYIKPQR